LELGEKTLQEWRQKAMVAVKTGAVPDRDADFPRPRKKGATYHLSHITPLWGMAPMLTGKESMTTNTSTGWLARIAPGLAALLGYRRADLSHDLIAGLSVAAVALPVCRLPPLPCR
jgi:hypothetical protein